MERHTLSLSNVFYMKSAFYNLKNICGPLEVPMIESLLYLNKLREILPFGHLVDPIFRLFACLIELHEVLALQSERRFVPMVVDTSVGNPN